MNFVKIMFIGSILLLIISCKNSSSQNNDSINQYKDGKKEGKWIEYLNDNWTAEVSKDSAKFYREVTYANGFPNGLVKDYYIWHKPQGEEFLISGPYTNNGVRPKDKATGLMIYFDEKTSNIINWEYYDKNGILDYKRYSFTGYDEIEKDKRFSKGFWLANDKQNLETDKNFKFAKENPSTWAAIIDESVKELTGKSQKSNNQYEENNIQSGNNQKVTCYRCQGSGLQICGVCGGNGREICRWCSGTGKEKMGGQDNICNTCNGNGYRVCSNCSGKGRFECKICWGRGYNIN